LLNPEKKADLACFWEDYPSNLITEALPNYGFPGKKLGKCTSVKLWEMLTKLAHLLVACFATNHTHAKFQILNPDAAKVLTK
jgi:hypothetical protein